MFPQFDLISLQIDIYNFFLTVLEKFFCLGTRESKFWNREKQIDTGMRERGTRSQKQGTRDAKALQERAPTFAKYYVSLLLGLT